MRENFVEDLVVTFDDIEDMPESAPINPSDEMKYWFVAVVLLVIARIFIEGLVRQ